MLRCARHDDWTPVRVLKGHPSNQGRPQNSLSDLNQIRYEASGQLGLVRLCSPLTSAPIEESVGQLTPKSGIFSKNLVRI